MVPPRRVRLVVMKLRLCTRRCCVRRYNQRLAAHKAQASTREETEQHKTLTLKGTYVDAVVTSPVQKLRVLYSLPHHTTQDKASTPSFVFVAASSLSLPGATAALTCGLTANLEFPQLSGETYLDTTLFNRFTLRFRVRAGSGSGCCGGGGRGSRRVKQRRQGADIPKPCEHDGATLHVITQRALTALQVCEL